RPVYPRATSRTGFIRLRRTGRKPPRSIRQPSCSGSSKHGIKMTGMPAWSDHSDEEIWATVGFIEKLPGMSEQEYASLVMASIAHGGHHSVKGDDRSPSDIRVKP